MHLSRLVAPRNWPIPRKERKWIARPIPGPHGLKQCLPLVLVLKYMLGLAKTTREAKKILNDGNIIVNKKIIKEHRFPIGIMDVIEIPKLEKSFVMLYDKQGNFKLQEIKDTSFKLCKIIGKTVVKHGKLQLNLHDSRNILLDKNMYHVGDTIVFDFNNKKIKDAFELKEGCWIMITDGRYKGYIGKVKQILHGKYPEKPKIVFQVNGEEHITLKDYAFVIGSEKPVLPI